MRSSSHDHSNESITILFSRAKEQNSFAMYQELGDWLLFTKTLFPKYLTGASSDYFDVVAQISYDRCYRIVNKRWDVFEELADRFPNVVEHLHSVMNFV